MLVIVAVLVAGRRRLTVRRHRGGAGPHPRALGLAPGRSSWRSRSSWSWSVRSSRSCCSEESATASSSRSAPDRRGRGRHRVRAHPRPRRGLPRDRGLRHRPRLSPHANGQHLSLHPPPRELQRDRARHRRHAPDASLFVQCGAYSRSWRFSSGSRRRTPRPRSRSRRAPHSARRRSTSPSTAAGDAVSYHWDLGDGSQADGPVVQHRLRGGAIHGDGDREPEPTERRPRRPSRSRAQAHADRTEGRHLRKAGRVQGPGHAGVAGARISLFAGETEVRSGKADKKGRFSFRARLRAPARFTARFGSVVSNQSAVSLRPALDVALPSSRTVGQALVLRAALRPRGSGSLAGPDLAGRRELRRRDRSTVARLSA